MTRGLARAKGSYLSGVLSNERLRSLGSLPSKTRIFRHLNASLRSLPRLAQLREIALHQEAIGCGVFRLGQRPGGKRGLRNPYVREWSDDTSLPIM